MIPIKDKDIKTHPIENAYIDLLIASILHDIGKFWQRTGNHHHDSYNEYDINDFGYSGAHSKWSASFIKEMGLNGLIENLVLIHHKPESSNRKIELLAKILSKSDHYSSSEREDIEGIAKPVEEPLISVFSNLKLSSSNNSREYYYPLRKLDLKNISFPTQTKKEAIEGGYNLTPRYKELWKEFLIEAKRIANTKSISFDTIFYLLKKYTTYMPSAAYVSYPDISLFDHLKTTAAISSCIYQYINEKDEQTISDKTKYFNLISGDISGIQDFIYDISSPQFAQKGMTKRLRGRSFYVNLLNDNLAKIIISKLDLTDANILWCGGGNFLVIAPNTNKAEIILRNYEKEINEYLFRKYGHKLFFSLTSQHISGKDLENLTILKENILFENARKNRQKYLKSLDIIFKEEEFVPSNLCKICGSISDKDVCGECKIHEDIGDKITKAEYMVRAIISNSKEFVKFDFQEFNVGFLFLKKEDLLEEIERISKLTSKIHVYKLNSTDFLDKEIIKKLEEKQIQVSFGFSFIANTVPSHEKIGLLNFEHIAQISRGTKKLGILKMDIDNLRKLFEIGLGNTVSISRISTMSSLVEIFVSGYINELVNDYYVIRDICPQCKEKVDDIIFSHKDNITLYREKEIKGKIERVCNKCAEKKIPILYIGYSSGDDLLIIGPWDIIVRFSMAIRNRFKKYTCMNKDINISAGVHMCGHKFPMDRAVHIVDDMLNKSKILDKYKDKISIFDETVKWESFDQFKGYDELLQFADRLELLIETEKVSKGFVYSLLILLNQIFGDLEESEPEAKIKARIERKKYVPILKYKLARVVKDNNIREDLNKKLITERMLPWIRIPASITILKWRKK